MNWINIKSALVSVVLAAIVAVGGYIIGVGDYTKIDLHVVINTGIMTVLVGVVSLIKSSGTNSAGKFAGVKVQNK